MDIKTLKSELIEYISECKDLDILNEMYCIYITDYTDIDDEEILYDPYDIN